VQLRSAVLSCTAALLTAAACANDNPGDRTAVHRDSAGIDIVANRVTPALATWTVATEPVLSIGTAEGEDAYQFFGISGLHRFDDGRIGVVNAGSRQVRVFDAEGTFIRSIGQQGNGPEEFQLPVLAGVLADTLIIVDNQAGHRLSFVHPDAGVVRVVRVADDVGGFLNPVGALDGGRPVFGGALDMSKTRLKAGFNRASTFYRAANPDGSLAADFGDVPGAEFWIESVSPEGRPSQPVLIPFARTGQAAAGGDRFYFGDQGSFEIRAFDPAASLVRIIRLAQEPVAVTEQDRQRYIDATLANVPNAEQADALRRQLNGTPLPEAFPAFATMTTDRAGLLWVAEYDRPGEERNAWLVFDHDGELVARITLPHGFNPLDIGDDFVLGAFTDELGVETVRMYTLDRSGSRT
jgi:hypothetical protein